MFSVAHQISGLIRHQLYKTVTTRHNTENNIVPHISVALKIFFSTQHVNKYIPIFSSLGCTNEGRQLKKDSFRGKVQSEDARVVGKSENKHYSSVGPNEISLMM